MATRLKDIYIYIPACSGCTKKYDGAKSRTAGGLEIREVLLTAGVVGQACKVQKQRRRN